MGTRRISIIGSLTQDNSGNVLWEPSSLFLTNDRHPGFVLRFKNTDDKIKASGSFSVPKDYVGTPKIIVIWATSAVAGNAVWDADTKAIAAGESMDPNSDDDNATVTTAAAETTLLQSVSSMTLTGTYAVDDLVQLSLGRDGAAPDTIAADLLVWDVLFEYADA